MGKRSKTFVQRKRSSNVNHADVRNLPVSRHAFRSNAEVLLKAKGLFPACRTACCRWSGLAVAMLSVQVLDMLNVSLLADGESSCLQPPNAELHAVDGDCLSSVLPDVLDKLWQVNTPGGTSVLNSASPVNTTTDLTRSAGANVPEVLEDGVLELRLLLEHDLSPGRVLGIGEDPTVQVLRFYDEDTKP